MKRLLLNLVRVAAGLCLQVLGLWVSLGIAPFNDEAPAPFSLIAFIAVMAASGVVSGLVARRYLLMPALLLFWFAWMTFIGLELWSQTSPADATYVDGLVEHWSMIIASSVALAAGIELGYFGARRLWPAAAATA
ncbi:hypothetical protein [Lysobacter gummosus]|jgi:hypothetical protein|uniref:hypothetical protein n=1 Tax=Lysobacter gummosus TaxID=262324 RepID=UPI003642EFDE